MIRMLRGFRRNQCEYIAVQARSSVRSYRLEIGVVALCRKVKEYINMLVIEISTAIQPRGGNENESA